MYYDIQTVLFRFLLLFLCHKQKVVIIHRVRRILDTKCDIQKMSHPTELVEIKKVEVQYRLYLHNYFDIPRMYVHGLIRTLDSKIIFLLGSLAL